MRSPLLVAFCVLLLFWARAANAHPVHASYAEMEFNPESRSLEVALRIQPEDLEKLLKSADSKTNDNNGQEEFAARIVSELKKYFHVTGPDSQVKDIKWIGHEVDLKEAWLYFEIPLGAAKIQQCAVGNTLFLGERARQINTIYLKHGKRNNSFHFFRGNSESQRMKLKPTQG